MQSTSHLFPSSEAIPAQMREIPDRLYYQSWPCSSNYVYVHPTQVHGCCGHFHFPGSYGLRSPHSQPAPHYFHGNYAVPPGAYPIHYIPPPHHIMELPHYEYDKHMDRYHHCCGCPNHPCSGKGGKNEKIEEADPHSESKVDQSLVPFNFRNYSDPLVWYSPSGSKIQGGKKTNDLQYEKQEDSPDNTQSQYPHPILWFLSNVGNKMNKKSNEPMSGQQEGEFSSAKTNYPYPILWFPPAYNSNQEDDVSNEPKTEKEKGSSNGLKTPEISKSSEQQQNFMNGWFPFVTNKLTPSKSGLPREELQQQGEDKPGIACPVFWIPYKMDGKESQDNKRSGFDQECAQRTPPRFEVLPGVVPATKEEDNNERNDKIMDCGSRKEIVKSNKLKTIPVKQAEPLEGEKKGESARSSEIPGNFIDAGKLSKDGGKKKSPSPTKSSKLPPVCLRVDPMPRKRTANGSSRSPSPPGDQGKSNKVSAEDLKPGAIMDTKQIPQPSLPHSVAAVSDNEKEQCKSKVRTVQVSEGTGSEAGNCELSNNAPDVVLVNHTSEEPAVDLSAADVNCKGVAGANSEGLVEDKSMHVSCRSFENMETLKAEGKHAIVAKEPKRITLSEAEAARIIQSAYRGYAVRRWEPLIKLKQVMEVKMKVAELKGNIQAFESSLDIQGFDKWRTVIGETIMSLLLKLDTIQGVHPSIRDLRRSVAKELVGLQEKVDHIAQKKVEITSPQDSPGEGMDSKADLCNKKGQKEEKQGQEDIKAETEAVNEFHPEGACQAENNHTPQESITEVTTVETKSHYDDPSLDAVSNSQTPFMPTKVADESETSLEPISKAGSAETELEKTLVFHQVDDNPASGGISSLRENEVSELKDLEEFPKGEINEDISTADNLVQNEPRQEGASEEEVMNDSPEGGLEDCTDIKDNYLVKDNQGADEVLAESYLDLELAQLPQVVLDDDCESNVHLQIEEGERKHKTDVERVDVNAEGADRGSPDANSAAPRQETTFEVPVTSGANESLESAKEKHNTVELRKMTDEGSGDLVQDLAEEASFQSVDVHEAVHGKEKMESCAEILNDKSEVNGYFALENEIPAVTATDTTETCEEELQQLSFLGSEGVNVSGGENRFADSKNSSNRDEPQECDSPVKLSKSCDAELEEKQLNDKIELQASGGAGGNGIDMIFTETCDCGGLEEELLHHGEYDSSKAKQELPPPSPTASEISLFSEGDRKLIEENMKLREMMQKLIEAGQDQLTAISNLSSRVKELEKRISKKKKLRLRRHGGLSRSWSGSTCLRPPSNDNGKVNAVAMAM